MDITKDENMIYKKSFIIQEMKSFDDNEDGYTFKGYLSTYENADRTDDVITKGAFNESLNRKQKVTLLFSHQPTRIVGHALLTSDEKGVLAEGYVNKNVPEGKIMYEHLKAGDIDEMSIGMHVLEYKVLDPEHPYSGGWRIDKADILEASLVAVPANTEAELTEVKEFILGRKKGMNNEMKIEKTKEELEQEAAEKAAAEAAEAAEAELAKKSKDDEQDDEQDDEEISKETLSDEIQAEIAKHLEELVKKEVNREIRHVVEKELPDGLEVAKKMGAENKDFVDTYEQTSIFTKQKGFFGDKVTEKGYQAPDMNYTSHVFKESNTINISEKAVQNLQKSTVLEAILRTNEKINIEFILEQADDMLAADLWKHRLSYEQMVSMGLIAPCENTKIKLPNVRAYETPATNDPNACCTTVPDIMACRTEMEIGFMCVQDCATFAEAKLNEFLKVKNSIGEYSIRAGMSIVQAKEAFLQYWYIQTLLDNLIKGMGVGTSNEDGSIKNIPGLAMFMQRTPVLATDWATLLQTAKCRKQAYPNSDYVVYVNSYAISGIQDFVNRFDRVAGIASPYKATQVSQYHYVVDFEGTKIDIKSSPRIPALRDASGELVSAGYIIDWTVTGMVSAYGLNPTSANTVFDQQWSNLNDALSSGCGDICTRIFNFAGVFVEDIQRNFRATGMVGGTCSSQLQMMGREGLINTNLQHPNYQ